MTKVTVTTEEKIVSKEFQINWPFPLSDIKPVFEIVVSEKGDKVLVYEDKNPEHTWKKYILHRLDPKGKIVCESYAPSLVQLKLEIDSISRDLAIVSRKQVRVTRKV